LAKKALRGKNSGFHLLIGSVVPGRTVLSEGSISLDGLVELATTQFLNYFRLFEEYIRQIVVNGTKGIGDPNHAGTSDSPRARAAAKKNEK
jgi:hypothetical protein